MPSRAPSVPTLSTSIPVVGASLIDAVTTGTMPAGNTFPREGVNLQAFAVLAEPEPEEVRRIVVPFVLEPVVPFRFARIPAPVRC
jgi:hypothetical protein